MEIYPSAILDEDALPVPKVRMKALLRVAMEAYRHDRARIEFLRMAWLMLASFQPGIGPTPLSPPTLSGTRPTKAEIDALDHWRQLFEVATTESQLNVREADSYLESLLGTQPLLLDQK